jgi:hypothetical protein
VERRGVENAVKYAQIALIWINSIIYCSIIVLYVVLYVYILCIGDFERFSKPFAALCF